MSRIRPVSLVLALGFAGAISLLAAKHSSADVAAAGTDAPGLIATPEAPHAAVSPVPYPCPRFEAGDTVVNPPSLASHGGILNVNLSYQTTTDSDGRTLFCFMTPDGLEDPTLYVNPGDRLILTITNNTPAQPFLMAIDPPNCGAFFATTSSVNFHTHGFNVSPACTQDQVIKTVINSGQTFTYTIRIPKNEPAGLYWYHPHIHGQVEAALQGGASGTIVVNGIQRFQPAVAGMEERVLVIRDQNVASPAPTPGGDVPSWDVTLNYIPISYPAEIPAVIPMKAGKKQFWRVSNSAADTVIDLQVQYDGTPETLQVVAFDGVVAGSQDGSRRGKLVNTKDILLPPAGRAEFIVTGPSRSVGSASLVTLGINTGPDGDNDPPRTLATIETGFSLGSAKPAKDSVVPPVDGPTWKQRFEGLSSAVVTATHTVYFSENNAQTKFFVTADDAIPTVFDANNPPAIVTTQGSVEDWTIQNRSLEVHEFHIHQIHFQVLSENNFETNGSQLQPYVVGQFLDTVQVPYWDGNLAHPFPSVTIRMDFRGPDIGDFVYHCHIVGHEDLGMMAIIRVMPSSMSAAIEKIRIRLASIGTALGLYGAEKPKDLAWCVGGKSWSRRPAKLRARDDDRAAARKVALAVQ
ncbi:MAG TPA: multicopper oxidase domain-containing protein [Candidatus Binataceae bacterium]|nr:multicopper oxidase domain-containing protein [Candidatus Binataceae bacterium]